MTHLLMTGFAWVLAHGWSWAEVGVMLAVLPLLQTFAPSIPGESAPAAGGPTGDPAPTTGEPSIEGHEPAAEPADAAPATGEAEDDEPSVFEDDETAPVTTDRFKAVQQRGRRFEKQYRKLQKQMAGYAGVDVEQLRHQARTAEQYEQVVRNNPHVRRLLGLEDGGSDGGFARPYPTFDEAGFRAQFEGYDLSDPQSQTLYRTLHAQAQANHDLKRESYELAQQVAEIRGHLVGKSKSDVSSAWSSSIDQAAKLVPEKISYNGMTFPVRELFTDNVKSAYVVLQSRGVQVTPQHAAQIVGFYLTKFGINPNSQQGRRVQAAAAERMAQGNKALPRANSISGGGSPAPARAGKPQESLHAFSARLRKDFG